MFICKKFYFQNIYIKVAQSMGYEQSPRTPTKNVTEKSDVASLIKQEPSRDIFDDIDNVRGKSSNNAYSSRTLASSPRNKPGTILTKKIIIIRIFNFKYHSLSIFPFNFL
jgi:hypothetical protein